MGRADSPLRDRVIFVEGAPRSGTTLLASFVGSHPDVAGVVAESHLFDRGVNQLFANHESDRHYLSSYLSAGQLTELSRELCDGVLMAMRERVKPGAEFVTEKTPVPPRGAEQLLRRKLEIYPDGRYLHVVRDGAEAVRSLMRAPWNRHGERDSREWWRAGVAGIRAALADADNYLEVEYSELADSPRATMAAVYDWLGIEGGDEALDRVDALSRERISSFGPGTDATPGSSRQTLPGRLVSAATRRRRRLRPVQISGSEGGLAATQALVAAARRLDQEGVEAGTTEDFELTLRSGSGDATASGLEARQLLLDLCRATFPLQFATESWAPISGQSSGEQPLTGMILSATRGDGDRVDLAFAALSQGDRVRSLAVISAGDPAGRASKPWKAETE